MNSCRGQAVGLRSRLNVYSWNPRDSGAEGRVLNGLEMYGNQALLFAFDRGRRRV